MTLWYVPRISPVKGTEKGIDPDSIRHVYAGEYPEEVRDAFSSLLQYIIHGDAEISGGMDKGTALSWIICSNRLFVWSYLSPATSKNCVILDIPLSVAKRGDLSALSDDGSKWMVSVVNWDNKRGSGTTDKVVQQCNAAGILMLNQKTGTVIYWPDIYSKGSPVCSFAPFDEF